MEYSPIIGGYCLVLSSGKAMLMMSLSARGNDSVCVLFVLEMLKNDQSYYYGGGMFHTFALTGKHQCNIVTEV